MTDDRRGSTNALQGVAALVGVTLGVIPLVGLALGRGPGLWTGILGQSGAATWWVPAVVVIACLLAVAVAERSVRR